MLQNPDSSLLARQRHRRQQSTPSAFEALAISSQRPAGAGHRRGRQSLDIRQQKQRAMWQANQTVSTEHTNNPGSAIFQQQYAQQHSTQVSPGQQHGLCSPSEEALISPLGTPQMPAGMDAFEFSSMCNGPFADWSMLSGRPSNDFDLYSQSSATSTPTFASFQDATRDGDWFNPNDQNTMTRGHRRSLGGAVQKRVEEYENLASQGPQRPITPPEQNNSFDLPITPMETPHDRMTKLDRRPDRFSEGYDESMEETLKPVRGRAAARPQSTFMEMRQQAEQQQHANPALTPSSSGLSMTRSLTTSSLAESDFSGVDPFSQFVDTGANFDTSSQASLPQTPQTQSFFSQVHNTPSTGSHHGKESPSNPHSHRRKQSQASIVSAQSIADIRIEETMQETGVTMEEIEQFISGGPGASDDGKYICIFEECGKTFGRKENIKSHVQTHLDDRKFLCQHCKKCFVRLHDLKRHAKIHTGIKPYVCQCGRDFARHDALTRHRQRGMCIGSFEGAVRASAKRGRPKKPRPDLDARQEKAARTRKKNMSISSISSQVDSAQSSAASTPRDPIFDLMSMDPSTAALSQEPSAMSSSAPMPTFSAAPTSRSHGSTSPAPKTETCVSPQEIMEALSSQPTSPAKSMGSQHNTPPELSQSPSPAALTSFAGNPPGAQASRQFDSGLDTLSPESFGGHSAIDDSVPLSVDDQFNELMFHLGDDDPSFVQLDHAPSMLLSHKSSEEYDDTVHMFGEPDDMFAM